MVSTFPPPVSPYPALPVNSCCHSGLSNCSAHASTIWCLRRRRACRHGGSVANFAPASRCLTVFRLCAQASRSSPSSSTLGPRWSSRTRPPLPPRHPLPAATKCSVLTGAFRRAAPGANCGYGTDSPVTCCAEAQAQPLLGKFGHGLLRRMVGECLGHTLGSHCMRACPAGWVPCAPLAALVQSPVGLPSPCHLTLI